VSGVGDSEIHSSKSVFVLFGHLGHGYVQFGISNFAERVFFILDKVVLAEVRAGVILLHHDIRRLKIDVVEETLHERRVPANATLQTRREADYIRHVEAL
jgi:hypothetical protein